ncbi:putative membrane protein [Rhodoblastus acidophilus]|uniref:heparan-alpha-glucosaminide N-acetyltransferase n=1 Tax=Rhodoblastus acidophilus TaxID=1074 RepID=UPI00222516E9|nr:heparan-alpha-glucosaminide N-acetyltransferase [Rhodoblastus acidophilus]MCW2284974.1 putative membrane protein [Rhodoblastus acidophilus]MCW2333962.1 putative membrane protein [Rhodoblastus acidophilus]
MSQRLPWIDAARGGALLAMAAYHFTWDLAEFRWIDGAVTASRAFHFFGHAIAASFLALSGYSLVLARRARGEKLWRDPHYWRRWSQVVAAAAAVTLASYALFPEAPIFFGILHCIALSSLLALPFVEAPLVAVFVAAGLALAAPLLASPVFDAPQWWWTGLSALTPISNDYRPLLPWLGFMLLGVGLARLPLPARGERVGVRGWAVGFNVVRKSFPEDVQASAPAPHPPPSPRTSGKRGPARPFIKPLAFLGRHSLAFYLIHQPVLYGALALIGPQAARIDEAGFLAQCTVQCAASGADAGHCEASCGCVVARAKAAGRWRALALNTLDAAQRSATHDDAVACYADSAR